ncbi:MAG: NAD(P)-dependent oxidoreductase [Ectothiorhodospiraceae bacterium]|nr:NAD(P)-dependent oxidoreductase [Chromatiales bacterium]MCP5154479.1 NAD(P)-dependent oxidoreductase [Ectothiorhodospiraceae bacterium]
MPRFERLLLTGAAGALGTELRRDLAGLARVMRLSDREPVSPAKAGEEVVRCDLADADGMLALTEDVDAVVHMGGVSRENTFANILESNIVGLYNLYEGCRKNGVGRVVFASSNHAIGFYPRTRTIDASVPHRPDSFYGVSKAFGEDLSRYYFDKYGIETVCLRIGSCFPEPVDRRMLATWLSYPDLARLVSRSLLAPQVGHMVVYGMSDNLEKLWDNTMASSLGYVPKDSAETYRERVEAATPVPDPRDPAVRFQGGGFTAAGHFED